jgi:hypothetical protein
MQLERTTFIYWAIECVPKALFGRAMQLEKTNFIYWAIECTSKT